MLDSIYQNRTEILFGLKHYKLIVTTIHNIQTFILRMHLKCYLFDMCISRVKQIYHMTLKLLTNHIFDQICSWSFETALLICTLQYILCTLGFLHLCTLFAH